MPTRITFLLCAVLFASAAAFAQITLTQNDAPAYGTETLSHMTMTSVAVDHGPAGANQSWTFGPFPWDMNTTTDFLNPDGTPYRASFPTATLAITSDDSPGTYSYLRVAANASYILGSGSPDTIMVYSPEWLHMVFPCTYGTNWISAMHVDRVIPPGIQYRYTDSTRFNVDGWGHITTPYGSGDCLRAFMHHWTIIQVGSQSQTTEKVGYAWYGNHALDPLRITSEDGVTDPNFTSGIVEMSERVLAVDPTRGPVARRFAVSQNYPNPFNPTTTLPLEVAQSARVTLSIYDETGRLVSKEAFQLSPGQHALPINGSPWATGTYFARVAAAGQEQTVKMQLVK